MNLLLHTHTDFSISLQGFGELFLDALIDCLKSLPFLFLAFLIIEFAEHHSKSKINSFFQKSGKAGPLAGALLGCVPQCGFSVLSANLYMGGMISLGTLIAVFLSTSDEAVILFAAEPSRGFEILRLLGVKVLIGILAGYIVDLIFRKKSAVNTDLCEKDGCGCGEHHGIIASSAIHTAKIFGFIFIITLILNFILALVGEEGLERFFLTDSPIQPLLAAAIGFIPNCAASVMLTKLNLEGALSFGSVVAGLCTGAGAGLLVLFRDKSRLRDNLKIMGILYFFAVLFGMIFHLIKL